MQSSVRLIFIGMAILCMPTAWCMNLARCVKRTKAPRRTCVRQLSHTPVVQLVVMKPVANYYAMAAENQKKFRALRGKTIGQLNALHAVVFDYDEKLVFLAQRQHVLTQELKYKKRDYNDCTVFYRVYDARDILANIKKLDALDQAIQLLMQQRANTCQEIKSGQSLLAHIDDEQKQLSGALWTLERANSKFDK